MAPISTNIASSTPCKWHLPRCLTGDKPDDHYAENKFINFIKTANFFDPERIYDQYADPVFIQAAHMFLLREAYDSIKVAVSRGLPLPRSLPYFYMLTHLQTCKDDNCRHWVTMPRFGPLECRNAQILIRHASSCRNRTCPIHTMEKFIRTSLEMYSHTRKQAQLESGIESATKRQKIM